MIWPERPSAQCCNNTAVNAARDADDRALSFELMEDQFANRLNEPSRLSLDIDVKHRPAACRVRLHLPHRDDRIGADL